MCRHLLLADHFTMVLTQITGAVVMTLRVYAIFDSNRRILYLLVSVLVTTTAISFYFILDISPNYPKVSSVPPQGCLRAISQQECVAFGIVRCDFFVSDFLGLLIMRQLGVDNSSLMSWCSDLQCGDCLV
ncbi:hypothetical protein V8B97DRAFT_828052 [Scleroderma yunnanense]